jgi:hypothetical protein
VIDGPAVAPAAPQRSSVVIVTSVSCARRRALRMRRSRAVPTQNCCGGTVTTCCESRPAPSTPPANPVRRVPLPLPLGSVRGGSSHFTVRGRTQCGDLVQLQVCNDLPCPQDCKVGLPLSLLCGSV